MGRRGEERRERRGCDAVPAGRAADGAPSGWWGMVLLIATEATLFLLLIATYFYLRFKTGGRVAAVGA